MPPNEERRPRQGAAIKSSVKLDSLSSSTTLPPSPPGCRDSTSDRLTVLRTRGLPATKTIGLGPDGRLAVLASYPNAKRFAARQAPVASLGDLAAALDRARSDEFVIRGEPRPGLDMNDTVRRLYTDPLTGEPATFREVPRRWVLLDFDTVRAPEWLDPTVPEDAAAYLRSLLPDDFHTASFWWAYTSSAGIKPGELRMRLAFWLDQPVGKAFLDRWLADVPVDPSLFRPVQAIYVARPILKGVADPVPRRSGVFVDVDDVVPVPQLPAEEPEPMAHPTHSPDGKRYVSGDDQGTAAKRLAALCRAVEQAAPGGRHRCLMWAAARAVELDDALSRDTIAAELIAAARRAGIDDTDRDLRRQVGNAFKLAIFGQGAAA